MVDKRDVLTLFCNYIVSANYCIVVCIIIFSLEKGRVETSAPINLFVRPNNKNFHSFLKKKTKFFGKSEIKKIYLCIFGNIFLRKNFHSTEFLNF